MKTKEIYLVRHGETDFNRKRIVQGSGVDSSLNDTGRAQAVAFFEQYQHVQFDKVYYSALKRTKQTIQGFLDKPIEAESLSGLNEISWGVKEGTPFSQESHQNYISVIEGWQAGRVDQAIEGGETPEEVKARQMEAWDHIMSKSEERIVLVCMHGRAMRILLAWVFGYHLQYMDMFEHRNTSLYRLVHTGSMFVMKRYNDLSHLQRIPAQVE